MYKAVAVAEEMPISVHHTIAEYYWLDARDFLYRFDKLWEEHTLKTGRVKAFVDLLIGCECALKSHVMLGLKEMCAKDAYATLRSSSHRISDLCDSALLSSDRSIYDFLKSELGAFSVELRYSLEAYDTLFPMLSNWNESDINYSKTIGSHPWVMSVRAALDRLISDLDPHLTGFVSDDLAKILSNAEEVKYVITSYKRKCRKIPSRGK